MEIEIYNYKTDAGYSNDSQMVRLVSCFYLTYPPCLHISCFPFTLNALKLVGQYLDNVLSNCTLKIGGN